MYLIKQESQEEITYPLYCAERYTQGGLAFARRSVSVACAQYIRRHARLLFTVCSVIRPTIFSITLVY